MQAPDFNLSLLAQPTTDTDVGMGTNFSRSQAAWLCSSVCEKTGKDESRGIEAGGLAFQTHVNGLCPRGESKL